MSAIDFQRASEEDRFYRHNFRMATDAPALSRALPPLQGDLVIGYNAMRRIYAVSSLQSQFMRDVQSFFRHVRGWGSSCDLSRRPDLSVARRPDLSVARRPDLSVIRWTLGLFRVWIIRQSVLVSLSCSSSRGVSTTVFIFYLDDALVGF